jgi:ABC-type lipoprotein export system ATPase subunit
MTLDLKWMADDAERRAFIAGHPQSLLVSPDMPLRANLSALDNIALIPQYRANLDYDAAADQAWALLVRAGHADMAFKRDPDLSHEERFVAKLLRAAIGRSPVVLVDRPGMLLPDLHYPPYLDALLNTLAGTLNACWILDYRWNAPLYPTR